jgi:hypothetical protein
MGFTDVRLYDGSWFKWGNPDFFFPVETRENRPASQALPDIAVGGRPSKSVSGQSQEGQERLEAPIGGYYFQPPDPENLLQLNFVVYNEDAFYTLDFPVNTKLFDGKAVFDTLSDVGRSLPGVDAKERMSPVVFEQAPRQWLQSRPHPRDAYFHFHSCYDARGAVRHGYWLRHVGVAEFTYYMGGRVSIDGSLYHRVKKGVDRDFARLIEFDRGPR